MPSLVEVADWGKYSKSAAPANAATLLAAASASIRSYCGWSITREVVQDFDLDSYGGSLLVLPTLVLVSVESVYVDDAILVDRVDYRWSRRGLIRRTPKGYSWPNEYNSIRASWTHGYETCPEDIAAFCVSLAKRIDNVPAGILQKQVGGISVQFKDAGFSEAEMGVLDPYALESGRTN